MYTHIHIHLCIDIYVNGSNSKYASDRCPDLSAHSACFAPAKAGKLYLGVSLV